MNDGTTSTTTTPRSDTTQKTQSDTTKTDDTAQQNPQSQQKLTVPANFTGVPPTIGDSGGKAATDAPPGPVDAGKTASLPGAAAAGDATTANPPIAVGDNGTKYFRIADNKIAALGTDNKYTFLEALPADVKATTNPTPMTIADELLCKAPVADELVSKAPVADELVSKAPVADELMSKTPEGQATGSPADGAAGAGGSPALPQNGDKAGGKQVDVNADAANGGRSGTTGDGDQRPNTETQLRANVTDNIVPRPDANGTQWYSVEANKWIGWTPDHKYITVEGPISPAALNPPMAEANTRAGGSTGGPDEVDPVDGHPAFDPSITNSPPPDPSGKNGQPAGESGAGGTGGVTAVATPTSDRTRPPLADEILRATVTEAVNTRLMDSLQNALARPGRVAGDHLRADDQLRAAVHDAVTKAVDRTLVQTASMLGLDLHLAREMADAIWRDLTTSHDYSGPALGGLADEAGKSRAEEHEGGAQGSPDAPQVRPPEGTRSHEVLNLILREVATLALAELGGRLVAEAVPALRAGGDELRGVISDVRAGLADGGPAAFRVGDLIHGAPTYEPGLGAYKPEPLPLSPAPNSGPVTLRELTVKSFRDPELAAKLDAESAGRVANSSEFLAGIRGQLSRAADGANLASYQGTVDGHGYSGWALAGNRQPNVVPFQAPLETPVTLPRDVPGRNEVDGARTSNRALDSERKILEFFRQNTTPASSGQVFIYTERTMCGQCATFLEEFRSVRPGIEVVVEGPGGGAGTPILRGREGQVNRGLSGYSYPVPRP